MWLEKKEEKNRGGERREKIAELSKERLVETHGRAWIYKRGLRRISSKNQRSRRDVIRNPFHSLLYNRSYWLCPPTGTRPEGQTKHTEREGGAKKRAGQYEKPPRGYARATSSGRLNRKKTGERSRDNIMSKGPKNKMSWWVVIVYRSTRSRALIWAGRREFFD